MTTEYKEGPHDEFIKYLYSSEPHPKGTITLESPLDDPNKNMNLHIFEQLLMIFVDLTWCYFLSLFLKVLQSIIDEV